MPNSDSLRQNRRCGSYAPDIQCRVRIVAPVRSAGCRFDRTNDVSDRISKNRRLEALALHLNLLGCDRRSRYQQDLSAIGNHIEGTREHSFRCRNRRFCRRVGRLTARRCWLCGRGRCWVSGAGDAGSRMREVLASPMREMLASRTREVLGSADAGDAGFADAGGVGFADAGGCSGLLAQSADTEP